MIEAVIEQAVSHLLSTAVDKWKKSRVLDFPNFDFVYERDDGEKVAFEILGTDPNEYKLASISNLLNKEENVDQVYVVTQDSPTKIQLALFDGIVSPKKFL